MKSNSNEIDLNKIEVKDKKNKTSKTYNMKEIKNEYNNTGLIPKPIIESLQNQHYAMAGNHSVVEICRWTKKSILDEGVCYKQQFYGIRSHLCCQMSPVAAWCDHSCVFCWRATHLNLDKDMSKAKIDDPELIIQESIKAQRKQLSGFGGNSKVNLKKFKEAQEPMHFAISLTGEPTLYPKLPEFIKALHKKGKTSFLVTNGQHPEMLQRLIDENALPTQLYISVDAPNQELYKKIDNPMNSDGWERLMKSLEIMKKIKDKTRTVFRVTMIKGLNDVHPEQYAKLIKKYEPIFVEIKAYMWVGHSRKRLKRENMPRHEDIREFSKLIAKELNWKIIDEKKESRVVLIMKEDRDDRIMKFE